MTTPSSNTRYSEIPTQKAFLSQLPETEQLATLIAITIGRKIKLPGDVVFEKLASHYSGLESDKEVWLSAREQVCIGRLFNNVLIKTKAFSQEINLILSMNDSQEAITTSIEYLKAVIRQRDPSANASN